MKKLIAGLSTVLLSLGFLVGLTGTANAAGGKVTCPVGMGHVVGVWMEVSGGGSGWARLTNTSGGLAKRWSYDTKGRSWRAHVGCGGTPQKWKRKYYSDWTSRSGSSTITCYDDGRFSGCRVG